MKVYCIEDFKSVVDKLKKHKAYFGIEKEIIDYALNKSASQLSTGTLLNANLTSPYLKKRIGGSGGFRIYSYLIIKDDKAYLLYIHPKTGPEGSPNITDEAKTAFYKKILEAIENDELYELSCNTKGDELVYTKIPKVKKAFKE